MTAARLVVCTIALALAACATPGRTTAPTTPSSRYELCSDPQFECTPASAFEGPAATQPIQIDTNLASPRRAAAFG
ncbi:MAG: hypothetical protein IPQ07_20440 [Myxococcales bacterium]|nr:hypothetical protein [Myxococcales bacterium]